MPPDSVEVVGERRKTAELPSMMKNDSRPLQDTNYISELLQRQLASPKANDSVHIMWEPPAAPSGRILEYSMYMAVRKSRSTSAEGPGQMAFVRIYRGTKMSCTVSSSQLDNAHIDCSASNRPAVVLRIAAKNEQGYGPATQIRWIQDPWKVRGPASRAANVADADQDAADSSS